MKFIKRNINEAYFPNLEKLKNKPQQSSEERLSDAYSEAIKDKVNGIAEGLVLMYLRCQGYERVDEGDMSYGLYNYIDNKYSNYLYPLFSQEPSRVARGSTSWSTFNDSLKVTTTINMKRKEVHVKASYSFDVSDLPNSDYYNPGIKFDGDSLAFPPHTDVTLDEVNAEMTEEVSKIIDEMWGGEMTMNPESEYLYRILQKFNFYLDEIKFFDGESPAGVVFSNEDVGLFNPRLGFVGINKFAKYRLASEERKGYDDCISYILNKFKFGCKTFSLTFQNGYNVSNKNELKGVIDPQEILYKIGYSITPDVFIEHLEKLVNEKITDDRNYIEVMYERFFKYTIANDQLSSVKINLYKLPTKKTLNRARFRGTGTAFFITYCGFKFWFKRNLGGGKSKFELVEIIPPADKTSKIRLIGKNIELYNKEFYNITLAFGKLVFETIEKYDATH